MEVSFLSPIKETVGEKNLSEAHLLLRNSHRERVKQLNGQWMKEGGFTVVGSGKWKKGESQKKITLVDITTPSPSDPSSRGTLPPIEPSNNKHHYSQSTKKKVELHSLSALSSNKMAWQSK